MENYTYLWYLIASMNMNRRVFLVFHSFVLLLCIIWLHTSEGYLQIVPERANISYFNPKYVERATMNIRRYSRKSPYFINIEVTTKHTWDNNITVQVIANQLLHNEYRRSFVEMRHKLCDLINEEPYLGGMIKKGGVVCPLPAGKYAFMNMTAQTEFFPSVFPFERGRLDNILTITKTGEIVANLMVEATFHLRPTRQ